MKQEALDLLQEYADSLFDGNSIRGEWSGKYHEEARRDQGLLLEVVRDNTWQEIGKGPPVDGTYYWLTGGTRDVKLYPCIGRFIDGKWKVTDPHLNRKIPVKWFTHFMPINVPSSLPLTPEPLPCPDSQN